MKRYWMGASNGAVIPHESDTGMWVMWEDVEQLQDELAGYKLALSRQTDASEAMSMLEDAEAYERCAELWRKVKGL
jgi:hypothetical protein